MSRKPHVVEYSRFLVVPNTLENRPFGWEIDDKSVTTIEFKHREFRLMDDNTMIWQDINDATGLDVAIDEEEEIPYDKLDTAIEVTKRVLANAKKEEVKAPLQKLLDAMYLAKEKKTLLALYI